MNITRYTGATAEIDLNDDVNKHCGIGNGQHRVRLAQALVGALFGVDHPLAVEISHVSVGFATHVHFYIPKGTTGDELDSFRKALQEAVVACCVKHSSADSLPRTKSPLIDALESDDPAKAILDLWQGNPYSLPNTPPRTLQRQYEAEGIPGTPPITVASVPHCVKRNGKLWTLYVHNGSTLRYMGETYVPSDAPNEYALDLGNDDDHSRTFAPSSMPNTPPRTISCPPGIIVNGTTYALAVVGAQVQAGQKAVKYSGRLYVQSGPIEGALDLGEMVATPLHIQNCT